MGNGPVLSVKPAPEFTFLIYATSMGNHFKVNCYNYCPKPSIFSQLLSYILAVYKNLTPFSVLEKDFIGRYLIQLKHIFYFSDGNRGDWNQST